MKNIYKYSACAILLFGALLYFYLTGLPDGRLHVYMLDVGQGDAILIRTPSDQFILVDGGPDDSVLNELAEVMPFYRRDLALVILTHPHPDHVNGLVEVARRYDVGRVVLTGIDYEYAGYSAFLQTIAEKKIPVVFADGKDIQVGAGSRAGGGNLNDAGEDPNAGSVGADDGDIPKTGVVLLDMVFPFNSIQGQTFINANNSSIVFRLIYGKTVFFFAADCEQVCEEKIVASGGRGGAAGNADLRADVLKVGHHGSRTSTSEALLDAVFGAETGAGVPRLALIPVGMDNSFKHPYPGTVEKLQAQGVRILRTDMDGRVEVVSDGERIVFDK